jgi:hypothetical protein
MVLETVLAHGLWGRAQVRIQHALWWRRSTRPRWGLRRVHMLLHARSVYGRLPTMFPALGLFKGLHCPEIKSCQRHNCAFSHDATRKPPNTVHIPVAQSAPLARKHRAPTPPAASNAGGPSVTRPVRPGYVTPAKRTVTTQAAGASAPPPTKTARVGPAHQSKSITTATATLVSHFRSYYVFILNMVTRVVHPHSVSTLPCRRCPLSSVRYNPLSPEHAYITHRCCLPHRLCSRLCTKNLRSCIPTSSFRHRIWLVSMR